jgi:hypothetical protein
MRHVFFSVITLAALGCSTKAQEKWATLPNTVIELPLPRAASVKPDGVSIRIEIRPGFRHPRPISLAPADNVALTASYEHERSKSDTRLLWNHRVRTGGMGGPESHVEGVLHVREQAFSFTCSDQREGGPPPLDWCIDTLLAARHQ